MPPARSEQKTAEKNAARRASYANQASMRKSDTDPNIPLPPIATAEEALRYADQVRQQIEQERRNNH